MSLFETLAEDLKQAMKSGDGTRRDTLRLLQSALKNVAIEKRVTLATLSDLEVQEVIKRLVKQRKDSIAQYTAGNRPDLVAQEQLEMDILTAYLPAALPEAELRTLVQEALTETGCTTKDKMGQVMGVAMKKVAGRAVGDDVRRIVESLLT